MRTHASPALFEHRDEGQAQGLSRVGANSTFSLLASAFEFEHQWKCAERMPYEQWQLRKVDVAGREREPARFAFEQRPTTAWLITRAAVRLLRPTSTADYACCTSTILPTTC